MRRRYVLALVLATALIFALAGLGVGYGVWYQDQGESAACIRFRDLIEQNTDYEGPSSDERAVMTAYDDFCR